MDKNKITVAKNNIDTNKPIIVIQNTHYHFETALSLYRSLLNITENVYFYILKKQVFNQKIFLKEIGVNLATKKEIENACCGFVVSAYPNPGVGPGEAIPNSNESIFEDLREKLIYICHRFKDESDYNQKENNIKKENSLCLSPISSKIGLDYFHPIETPIKEVYFSLGESIKISIQGHFNLKNRDKKIINELINNIKKNIIINFIGTSSNSFLDLAVKQQPSGVIGINKNIKIFNNLKERYFYQILNNNTNFIMPCINEEIKNKTYANERYSSNFNLSFALEKPIFCHEFFEKIYNTPGIYYNDENFIEKLNYISNLKEKEYKEIHNQFKKIKNEYRIHNNNILEKKIKYIIEN